MTPGKKIDNHHRRRFDDRHLDYFQFFTLQTLPLNILILLSAAALFAKGSLGQSFKCFDSTHSKNAFYNVTKKKKISGHNSDFRYVTHSAMFYFIFKNAGHDLTKLIS